MNVVKIQGVKFVLWIIFWKVLNFFRVDQSLTCGLKKDPKIVYLELLAKQRSTLAKCKEMHPHAEPDNGQPYVMQRTTLHWLRVPKYVCGPEKDLENLLTKHRSTVAIYKGMYSHAEPDHGQPCAMQRTALHWLRVPK